MKKIVRVYETIEEFNQAAASEVACILQNACQLRGKANLCLSGGSTPKGVYQVLAKEEYRTSVQWGKVHFFWGDERCVSPDDPESNYRLAYENLLKYLPVNSENIHRVKGELEPSEAALDYAQVLLQCGEDGHPWPIFDAAVMGMGEDGHTASLFPGVENPGENLEPVIQVNARYQNRPASRITLTPMVFNSSRNLLFLVTGEGKAAVLQKVFSSQKDYLNLPIQRIEPKQGNLIWHLDASAAKYLGDLNRPPNSSQK